MKPLNYIAITSQIRGKHDNRVSLRIVVQPTSYNTCNVFKGTETTQVERKTLAAGITRIAYIHMGPPPSYGHVFT